MLVTFQKINYEGVKKRMKSSLKELFELDKKGLSDAKINKSKTYKKFRKAQYLNENYRSFFNDLQTDHLINFFRKENGYNSWIDVYIFKTTDLEIVKQELESLYVEIDGSSWSSPYDCTGRAFFRSCDFLELEDRIIVSQWGGLDV